MKAQKKNHYWKEKIITLMLLLIRYSKRLKKHGQHYHDYVALLLEVFVDPLMIKPMSDNFISSGSGTVRSQTVFKE